MYELKLYSLEDDKVVTFASSTVDTLHEAKLVAAAMVGNYYSFDGVTLDHLRPPFYKAMFGGHCIGIVSIVKVSG